MSESAIENEDVVVDADDESSGNQDQILVEGEEPSSKTATGPAWLHKRIGKLNDKIDNANSEAEKERRRAELKEEENKLLRLQVKQLSTQQEVSDDDQTGLTAEQIDERVNNLVEERLKSERQSSTQAETVARSEKKLGDHYDRAAELNVSDYEATEDAAIDALGKDLSRFIMQSTGKSHLIMYHLGKNPVKAQQLADRIRKDPGSGAVEIGELAAKITLRKANTQQSDDTPSPPSDIEGGGTPEPTGKWQKKLDKLRDQVGDPESGVTMADIMKLKREAEEKGIAVT